MIGDTEHLHWAFSLHSSMLIEELGIIHPPECVSHRKLLFHKFCGIKFKKLCPREPENIFILEAVFLSLKSLYQWRNIIILNWSAPISPTKNETLIFHRGFHLRAWPLLALFLRQKILPAYPKIHFLSPFPIPRPHSRVMFSLLIVTCSMSESVAVTIPYAVPIPCLRIDTDQVPKLFYTSIS